MIGLMFLLASVGTATPSLESLNAADLAGEVRPGGVNGSPFWNAFAWQFIYAPSFDFKPVDGAANYRFRLTDAQGREHVFCADSPQASLAPVWKDVVPGAARLEVTALDAGGRSLGLVATNGFHRSAPFRPGAYPPAVCGYGTCAERALDWMFRSRWVNGWASGEVDKTYQLNCYPSKMVPATMLAMVEYAKRHPEGRQKAMQIAENAADWMMANSVKEPEAMRGLPITYLDYYEETKHLGDVWNSKKIAHEKRDQVMMIYPASVGKAYLGLFKATGERKYFEYARTIADRYLALQRPDGSWALVLEFPSGREVSSNAAGETGICEFLDEMGVETGDVRYRQASDRAIPAMVRRIREFDWEGQFEDTAVQRVRYANLSKHIAAETMLYLLDRFPDGRYAKDAREVLRFAEDQFVVWSHPWGRGWYTPGVIEQYNCRVTIDASYAKMIRFYLKMYEVERNPLDLAKARALGDAITRNQRSDGLIPTVFPNDPGRAGRHWLNCMMATIRALLELEDAGTKNVVEIYANSFREGGWSLDVQFMDKMGSPYLLAHGLGSPVPDATATATVPEAGLWRVYVRSRKWVDGAGFFKVLVDGRPLGKTFGAASATAKGPFLGCYTVV